MPCTWRGCVGLARSPLPCCGAGGCRDSWVRGEHGAEFVTPVGGGTEAGAAFPLGALGAAHGGGGCHPKERGCGPPLLPLGHRCKSLTALLPQLTLFLFLFLLPFAFCPCPSIHPSVHPSIHLSLPLSPCLVVPACPPRVARSWPRGAGGGGGHVARSPPPCGSLLLKCTKCGVVSSAAMTSATASSAMLVPRARCVPTPSTACMGVGGGGVGMWGGVLGTPVGLGMGH